MKHHLAAMAITCLLSASALAGDIPISGSPAPTSTISLTSEPISPGEIPSVGKSELSSDALNALLSVLSFVAS